jgi:uncharacterized protein YggE
MRPWQKIPMSAMAVVLVFAAMQARADEPGATVSASGYASAPQKPEILRMTVTVSAQGTDIRDALAKLKAKRDDITANLLATGADKDSIKFSDLAEGNGENLTPQQRMMRQMMAARNQQPASTQPSGVTISSNLTAQWPLSEGSPDDALAAAAGLEDKIKAAMPTGKTAANKTPEEEEVAEEMAAQQAAAGQTKADEPQFVFVHRLTEDERAKLLAQAFADAQTQSRRLASAAGKQLGDVTHISTSAGKPENPYSAYVETMLGASGDVTAGTDDNEATSPQLNNLTYSVRVEVTFMLK